MLDVAAAAQLACLLEVSAPKPGNVSPGRHFSDTRYEDFLASAAAIGSSFARAADLPLGALIHQAVGATSQWTRSNTNLGIVLLLAPLTQAASHLITQSRADAIAPSDLRRAVMGVLEETTIDDSREVYKAIRLASPGGLGRTEEQDILDEPTMRLTDIMRLAAARDAVAREYATIYETTFEVGAPAVVKARSDGLTWDQAVTETFLQLLSLNADSHITRRAGLSTACKVSQQARRVIEEGGIRTSSGREALRKMDAELRDSRNMTNPGATADLTAAGLFVALVGGHWSNQPGGADAGAR